VSGGILPGAASGFQKANPMTESDFNRWWQDFRSRFPSKAAWIDKAATEHTLATWFEILADTDYDLAMSANSAIHRGEYEFQDSWDLIPQTIADIAERLKINAIVARSQSDEPDLSGGRQCQLCDGTGLVTVYHAKTITAVEKRHEDIRFHSCGVACKCERGDRFATWVRLHGKKVSSEPYPRFDETKHCVFAFGTPHTDAIEDWLESRVPRYDFGAYGG